MHPSIPKYVQLIETIKESIQQQRLVPDEQLPNEDELALQHKMSRGTVRKAISELQRLGMVRKEQGRGTFVNETKPLLSGFSLVEFDHYIQTQDSIPSTNTLTFEIITAPATISDKLKIQAKEEVVHIVQLRCANDLPIVYEERYFAKALCPNITQADVEQSSIHGLLVDTYKIPLIRLSHTIEVTNLPDEKFDSFGVKETLPVFYVDRLSFTQIDDDIQPAVWYQAYYRADDYRFEAQFRTSI